MSRKPTAIDLFAGAGGVTLGLRLGGFRVLAAVENDPLAADTYRLNHPGVVLWEQDIETLRPKSVMNELGLRRGELDVLAACPPCQGYSTMRTRNGGKRNRDPHKLLILEVLRFVRALNPRQILLENVPRLAIDRRFAQFRMELGRYGYNVRHQVLNARDYGVAQRRRRLVLIASRLGEPNFAKPANARRTVKQAIGSLITPASSKDPVHNYDVRRARNVQKLIALIPKNGGSRMALGRKAQLLCHRKLDGFFDVYGRMAWDDQAPTITGGCINPSKGRFLHPQANRAITLREAALLQSFPRSYRFPMYKGHYAVALLIGNAMPPELIRRQAIALRDG